jgi:hypothetical protein
VSDIHDAKRGMDIHHGLDGGRRVSVERHDGSRLVTERGRRGFVERPYQYHGHDFARRSYYYHGARYDRFYNHYYYRGGYMNVYAPGFYFAPGFYGWAYNPWATPIAYGWGWAGNPWFAFYGGYFSPWNMYAGSAFWLADYMLAANLQAAYAAQAAAVAGGGAVSIPANQAWTDTGTPVVQGQTYTVTASGIVSYHNGDPSMVSSADGRPIDICPPGSTYHNGFPAPQLPCIAMIGKIGPDGAPFLVGHQKTFVAPITGELFFGMNDSFLPDNGGAWVATITSADGDGGGPQQASLSGDTPLSPDVKQAIADEVKNQLALENAEAAQVKAGQDVDPGSSGIARIIQDVGAGHPHIFVVGDGIDVTDASTQKECHLSDGDAVQMVAAPPASATAANVIVKSNKGGIECAPSSMVAVNISDLQEMQNHMREQIDVGLKEMQSKAGTGGLPQAPASAKAAPTEPQYASIAPPPSPQDQADLDAQGKDANAAETEAQGTGGTPAASNANPVDDVLAGLIFATPAAPPIAVQPNGLVSEQACFFNEKKTARGRAKKAVRV